MMIYYKLLTVLTILLLYFQMSFSKEWSECSRSCGTGVTYRTVPCHSLIDDCTGTKKEYQVCNTEDCPVNSTDFRTKQCQEVAEDSVSYSDMDNPCKLMCAPQGELPVERGTVIDGTPCDVSGVCVAGTCIPMGCDGLLGSDKRMDKCERCGATEGVCLHVPCNIKEVDEQENVYHVKLPAKSTHIKLHLKSSACNFLAISENKTLYFNHTSAITISGNKFKLNGNVLTSHGPLHEEILIQIQHCEGHEIGCKYYIPVHEYTPVQFGAADIDKHMWVVGENYTACSHTCGTGIQKSEIYCISIETRERVNDTLCKDFTKTELQPRTRNCSMPECPYKWEIGYWTKCSKSCDGGIRKRAVACVQKTRTGFIHVSVNSTACPREKPPQREQCNKHLCYNHWYTGTYSECSNDCGKGQRRRDVICLNAHGKKVANDSNCSSMKPREVDECIGDMCIYKWTRSKWSNCSVECGDGIRTRTIDCHRVADNKPVNETFCIHNISTAKPKALKSCKGSHRTGEWGVEDWGKCDVPECYKEGKQYRNIFCYCGDKLASEHPNIQCDMSDEPPTEQACNKTAGCNPRWVVEDYGPCNENCWKVGTPKCKQDGVVVSDALCLGDKPNRLMKCSDCKKCDSSKICKDIPSDESYKPLLCTLNCCRCNT